jgi:hypothetical protein
MVSKVTLCPECGKGILNYEQIDFLPNGDHTKICYYSCGDTLKSQHLARTCEMSITPIGMNAGLRKIKSVSNNKIRGKRVYEMDEKFREDDFDNPEMQTVATICRYRTENSTSVFHIVKYTESGQLKHIDCKTENNGIKCDNSWISDSESSLGDQFIFKYTSKKEKENDPEYTRYIKIHCLKCNAKYDVSYFS